jgi:hypothetical protein
MLKKKDPKKPFWKRLIKSTEKVNIESPILSFILIYRLNGLPLIGIIMQMKVNLIGRKK